MTYYVLVACITTSEQEHFQVAVDDFIEIFGRVGV